MPAADVPSLLSAPTISLTGFNTIIGLHTVQRISLTSRRSRRGLCPRSPLHSSYRSDRHPQSQRRFERIDLAEQVRSPVPIFSSAAAGISRIQLFTGSRHWYDIDWIVATAAIRGKFSGQPLPTILRSAVRRNGQLHVRSMLRGSTVSANSVRDQHDPATIRHGNVRLRSIGIING